MNTSGTIGQIELTLQEILDAAFRACRLKPQQLSGEMIENGAKVLQRMLNALPARVVPLWAQDHQILGLPLYSRTLQLPVGTVDVVSAHLWTYSRYDATGVEIGAQETLYDLQGPSMIAVLGYTSALAATRTVTIEGSADGATWFTIWQPGAQAYAAEVANWIALNPMIVARYVRVTGVDTFEIRDLLIAGTPREREIRRINHDDYTNLPQSSMGHPQSYWLDRKASRPEMRLWPTPDGQTVGSVVSIWRKRQLQDIGDMTQGIEIPARWEESLITALAYRIAIDNPDVDLGVIQMLKPLADEFTNIMAAEETDGSDFQISADVSGYTRG